MRIRMKSLAAGPAGARLLGEIYEVDAGEAQQLVDGGYAEIAPELEVIAPAVETPIDVPPTVSVTPAADVAAAEKTIDAAPKQ